MHPQMKAFRVVIHRGGTSKGIFPKKMSCQPTPLKGIGSSEASSAAQICGRLMAWAAQMF